MTDKEKQLYLREQIVKEANLYFTEKNPLDDSFSKEIKEAFNMAFQAGMARGLLEKDRIMEGLND